ncbi:MAG: hypothetical protein KGN34_07125 [Sphingomonadales bacterium]|nr:hypothetical protein [Sphingomonadales bacterium]
MVRVNFVKIEPGGKGAGFVREMSSVPRIGDYICMESGDVPLEVRTVIWNVFPSREHDVQVRFR